MNFATCSIDALIAECRRLQLERDTLLVRLEELRPAAEEHERLVELREKGGAGKHCLEVARRMLAVRLMKRALGEPEDDPRRHIGGELYEARS